MRRFFRGAIRVIGVLIVIGFLANLANQKDAPTAGTAVPAADDVTPAVAHAVVAAPAPQPSLDLPPAEAAFIRIAARGAQAYDGGANDMAKGAARPARAHALCQEFSGVAVADWIGKVTTLSSNTDGKGVLSVNIAPDVSIGTWNNAFSDIMDHTLIEPSAPVFQEASALHEGEMVVFSGDFIRSQTDCFEEGSITLGGSMDEPDYRFRFSTIRPAQ